MINPEKLRSIKLCPDMSDGLEIDVAVVGAGTSGLYTAYRLTADMGHPGKEVQIFEGSDRIAGRLESVVLPGLKISGELGGMRYLESQQIVKSLIEGVFADDLDSIPFPMGDDAHLFSYLRKQRVRADAWVTAQAEGEKLVTNYKLNDRDVGFSSDQLFNRIVYDVLMADPWFVETYVEGPIREGKPPKVVHPKPYEYDFYLTAQDWDEIKPKLRYNLPGPYQGARLYKLGFWNVIKDRVSEEGFDFLDEAGGYYSNTINWNAAEAFPYMVGDFADADTQYNTIQGGYDLLAYALGYHYLQVEGARIWSQNRLIRVERSREDGKPPYRLTFENGPAKARWTVYAHKVVLAMPRRSLELIDLEGVFPADSGFAEHLGSVIMEPSFKILMGFEYPWWREDFGAEAGHSITDLPLRQCYYFGTDEADSHSLLLGSYNDMRTVTFWIPLNEIGERHTPRPTRLLDQATVASIDPAPLASKRLVAEVMRELQEVHDPEVPIPEPFVAWYKDWTDDPYGGGYHAWKAGRKVWKTMPFMRRPVEHEAVHVCGEAYSDQQGWVEGAFCEAEKMLREHFGAECPAWLSNQYYMGW